MKILSTRQMVEVDRRSSEEFGIPSLLLMENAGRSLYQILESSLPDLASRSIAIACGKGNNGGDGLVLARHLVQNGIHPDVYLFAPCSAVSGDAAINLNAYLKSGEAVTEVPDLEEYGRIRDHWDRYDVIVDALLGTGITSPLEGLYAAVVSSINSGQAFVLSVDIPSGMFSDALLGGPPTVRADVTVTFTAPKVAHLLNEDQEALGELHVVPIGSPRQLLEAPEHSIETIEPVRLALAPRRACSHKGDFGHVLVVSGSRGKAGAAALCGSSALRSGAGLVTVCTPDAVQDVVAASRPELMTEGLPSTAGGQFKASGAAELLALSEGKNVMAVGPGMGRDSETVRLIRTVVRDSPIPVVLDADGLNAFEGCPDQLQNRQGQPLILTPHAGEFSRLSGLSLQEVLEQKLEISSRYARDEGWWVVLKTFRTIVAEPSGRIFVCPLGNSGMSTAGMGDVLTGSIASRIGVANARKPASSQAVTRAILTAVYAHSLAGDLAAEKLGTRALTAGDAVESLGRAFQELELQR